MKTPRLRLSQILLLVFALLMTWALLAGRRGPTQLSYRVLFTNDCTLPEEERQHSRRLNPYLSSQGLDFAGSPGDAYLYLYSDSNYGSLQFNFMDEQRPQIEQWLSETWGEEAWLPGWPTFWFGYTHKRRTLAVAKYHIFYQPRFGGQPKPVTRTWIDFGVPAASKEIFHRDGYYLGTQTASYPGPVWLVLAFIFGLPLLLLYLLRRPLSRFIPGIRRTLTNLKRKPA